MLKRSFDVAMSLASLVLLSPLLLAIGVAIGLIDGRPVLFRQRRIGWHRRPFMLYKFRTMRPQRDAETGSFDAGDPSRVTRFGSVLRRSKLDELPQLWNVFRGEMSLVGPRPEVAKWVSVYPEKWAVVHRVRPGMTDPASIEYRHEEQLLAQSANPDRLYRDQILPKKLALYEQYVGSRTILRDLRILLQTFLALAVPRREAQRT